MSNETLKVAHFEHVSSSGDLIFSADGRRFVVRVDDRLEQGILESRQIREENEGAPDPQASVTIPISTIQSLIRAGFSTTEVSEQYAVSEALVRRFARPVETEKKYAVEQFLSARAPGVSRRNVSDMIESSLASARLTTDSLQWKATRHGREPWHIHASFAAAGRTLKAEWAWDMRDNSVTPLNSLASKLLKASALSGDDDFLENRFGPFPMIPDAGTPVSEFSTPTVQNVDNMGDSPSSAGRDGRSETAGSDNAGSSDTPVSGTTGADGAGAAQNVGGEDRPGSGAAWVYGTGSSSRKTDRTRSDPSDASDANAGKEHTANAADGTDPDRTVPEPLVRPDQIAEHNRSGQSSSGQDDKPRRKSRRSAVPSWDEILFGE
ncbi:septation protein SepH [Bifidobacterium simiarum]|uniref:DUF3071 domain-containing protein n=1 Tax=Bifidobacterium simiarum TaxID=2045441 RepID=A0A2M9HHE3_9BIFI|nr:septation protein SepH [Bifidobacterium simiarum]MBT1165225.1 DUF3071 domain-containing protein [Bifidobacterium simiarum]PJM76235.1 hypothetical protein CSQ87_01605 [Bifidobacterium simiarum]